MDAGGDVVDNDLLLRDLPAAGLDVSALVRLLTAVDVADLSDADLLGVLAGWHQVASIAAAAEAAAVSELAARRPVSTSYPSDDIACALATTSRSAQALVARAQGLAEHPLLADGLRAGALDPRKVDVLLDEVARLPLDDADDVLRAAVTDAEGLTAPLLRRRARRLVAAVDPDAAAVRAERLRADRCVRVEPVGDAMAWFTALLPADQAYGAFSAIDALARNARTAEDDRSLDQRRADVFADVFDAILASGVTPDGTPLPTQQGAPVGLQVTLAATTLAGVDDLPGELAGYGPLPAPIARELASRADRYRPILTDDEGHVLAVSDRTYPVAGLELEPPSGSATGSPPSTSQPNGPPLDRTDEPVGYRPGASLRRLVVVRDETCVFPGCRQPASACDLDHAEPFDADRPAAEQTRPENLQPDRRHAHDQPDGHDDRPAGRDDPAHRECVRAALAPAGIRARARGRTAVLSGPPPAVIGGRRRAGDRSARSPHGRRP